MSYENGKKLVVWGFGLSLLVHLLRLFGLFFPLFGNLPRVFNVLLSCGINLPIGLAALGYLAMWLFERKTIDLVTGALTGLSALAGLLSSIGLAFGNLLSLVVGVYVLVLAVRAKAYNRLLPMLLVCAFLYRTFAGFIFNRFVYAVYVSSVSPVVIMVSYLGYAVCTGLCFIEAKIEC